MTVGFAKVSIKGEGILSVGVFLLLARPVDTALKPVRACATVVSSRYSAWRAPATLWIPAYAGMTVSGWCCLVVALPFTSGLRIKSAMT